jgi:MoaA/NifB/PqqE/SkfB family radical SAM enzyme
MMHLTGLHLLLTYQCTFECDHCFVWGSPWQNGTMTLQDIRHILQQAQDLGTVTTIYFEGGEPFLYYPVLLAGVQEAAALGFHTGIVSNAYWATSPQDAVQWLKPLAGLLGNLSVSSDLYHYSEAVSRQARNARLAAESLGIATSLLSIAQPEVEEVSRVTGQLPAGESGVMFRGRAAEKLIQRYARQPWEIFTECPHENLRAPARVHVDSLGNLHLCQGISAGNLFQTPLREICDRYQPESHPIVGPLLAGGPAELVRRYSLPHQEGYVDACHLCYEGRRALRSRFPECLGPDQVYGIYEN